MTYKGIVRGNIVELPGKVVIAEGTEVEVVIKGKVPGAKGNRRSILAALDAPAHCSGEEVSVLVKAIAEGKRPVRFTGSFDKPVRRP